MAIGKRIKQWLYGSCPGFAGAFPYYGTKVYFPKDSVIFKLACQQGIYEQENLRLILSLVRPDSAYFDVGANIGLMSIPLLQRHASCTVFSVEASPNTLTYLRRTVNESAFGGRWKVIDKALGSAEGQVNFFTAAAGLGAFDGLRDTRRAGPTTAVAVALTTLDLEWERAGKPAVSFIKIDIEGAELQALRGAVNCIRQERPYIMVEWNPVNLLPYDCDPESLWWFADELNYQLLSAPDLIPINQPDKLKLHMIRTESFLLAPNETHF